MSPNFVLFLWIVVGVGHSLDLKSVREGSCISAQPASNLNMTRLRSIPLQYFIAGNKLDTYGVIAGHRQFSRIREFEYYYDACLRFSLMDFVNGRATAEAFGGRLQTHFENFQYPAPGRLDVDVIPPRLDFPRHQIQHIVTLTDNETFVFFHACWVNLNQRGWSVVSSEPIVNSKTRKLIEDHALSLGYRSDQMIFFRQETCLPMET